MANYTYVPNAPKSRSNANNSENADYIGDFVNKNKKNIKIVATVLIAFFALYFIGSGITGNVLLSDTDRQLASSEDFPQLSKFEANKEYYLCNHEITLTKQQKATAQNQLDLTTTNLNTCHSEQTQTTNKLNTTTTSLSTCNTNLNICTTNNTELKSQLDLAEFERDEFKDDFDELQSDYNRIAKRYAYKKCCNENSNNETENAYEINSKGNDINCEVYDSDDDDLIKLTCPN